VVSGQLPYWPNQDLLDIGLSIRDRKATPSIPTGCDPVLAEIMTACWQQNPEDRPTFALISSNLERILLAPAPSPANGSGTPSRTVIPYCDLKREPPLSDLSAGVDNTKLEEYLSDEEFKTVLGVTREEFARLKSWQQLAKKKAAKLY